MTLRLDPRLDVLPVAQRELWPSLRPARDLGFVLYGGTAVALHIGHRASMDFDLFRTKPLDKDEVYNSIPAIASARVIQDEPDSFAARMPVARGSVKVSFFGNIRFGRIRDPLPTTDETLLVASLEDLLATKLKTILDRAEARDYEDIAAMLRHRVSLARGLAAFQKMFRGEPATVLRAMGWFEDGNLSTLSRAEREVLLAARDETSDLPQVEIMPGLVPAA
jgi:Nucleotidyl transferase AbiEii toxin, Type IV TA system